MCVNEVLLQLVSRVKKLIEGFDRAQQEEAHAYALHAFCFFQTLVTISVLVQRWKAACMQRVDRTPNSSALRLPLIEHTPRQVYDAAGKNAELKSAMAPRMVANSLAERYEGRDAETMGPRRKRAGKSTSPARPPSPNEILAASASRSDISTVLGVALAVTQEPPLRSTPAPRARSSRSNVSSSSRHRSRSRTRQVNGNAKLSVDETLPDVPPPPLARQVSSSACPEPRGATLSQATTSRPVTADVLAEGQLQPAGGAQDVLVELRDGRSVPNSECGDDNAAYEVRSSFGEECISSIGL